MFEAYGVDAGKQAHSRRAGCTLGGGPQCISLGVGAKSVTHCRRPPSIPLQDACFAPGSRVRSASQVFRTIMFLSNIEFRGHWCFHRMMSDYSQIKD
jgi:hypothetical protein